MTTVDLSEFPDLPPETRISIRIVSGKLAGTEIDDVPFSVFVPLPDSSNGLKHVGWRWKHADTPEEGHWHYEGGIEKPDPGFTPSYAELVTFEKVYTVLFTPPSNIEPVAWRWSDSGSSQGYDTRFSEYPPAKSPYVDDITPLYEHPPAKSPYVDDITPLYEHPPAPSPDVVKYVSIGHSFDGWDFGAITWREKPTDDVVREAYAKLFPRSVRNLNFEVYLITGEGSDQ